MSIERGALRDDHEGANLQPSPDDGLYAGIYILPTAKLFRVVTQQTDEVNIMINSVLNPTMKIALEEGKIVDQGSYGELLQRCKGFREMAGDFKSEK